MVQDSGGITKRQNSSKPQNFRKRKKLAIKKKISRYLPLFTTGNVLCLLDLLTLTVWGEIIL